MSTRLKNSSAQKKDVCRSYIPTPHALVHRQSVLQMPARRAVSGASGASNGSVGVPGSSMDIFLHVAMWVLLAAAVAAAVVLFVSHEKRRAKQQQHPRHLLGGAAKEGGDEGMTVASPFSESENSGRSGSSNDSDRARYTRGERVCLSPTALERLLRKAVHRARDQYSASPPCVDGTAPRYVDGAPSPLTPMPSSSALGYYYPPRYQPPPATIPEAHVYQRDLRVLEDPLYPPLNRGTAPLMPSALPPPIRTSYAADDMFRHVGYIKSSNDSNLDTGHNVWKLMGRNTNRNTGEYYIVPANTNADIKIPLAGGVVKEPRRLGDVDNLPTELRFDSPLLNKDPYVVTELPRSDSTSPYY